MNKNENKNYLHIFFENPGFKTCEIAFVTHFSSKKQIYLKLQGQPYE